MKFTCAVCGSDKAIHTTWTAALGERMFCCKCYVESGNPPAYWHPLCMSTWETLAEQCPVSEKRCA